MNMLARLMSQPIQGMKPTGDFYAPLELDESFERECQEAFAEPSEAALTPVERLQAGMDGILLTLRERDRDYDEEIADLETRLREAREDKAANLAQIARIKRSYAALSEEPCAPTQLPKKPSKARKAEAAA